LRSARIARLPRFLISRSILIERLDPLEFCGRNISLNGAPFVSRKGIGERSRFGLPDPALNSWKISQCEVHDGSQIPLERLVLQVLGAASAAA
jgi:hypothetical protein